MNHQTASHAVQIPEGANVPEWIQIIPAGKFSGRDGRGPYVTDATSILDWFRKWGRELVIDYEHPEIRHGQPVPGAGWIRALESRADGIYAKDEWTERARQMINAREYRYVSLVFEYDQRTGRIVRVRSAGLTNQPNLF
jgi:phage I-like protein